MILNCAYFRGRVVVESVKVTEIPEAGEGEWPLEPFCEDMCHDLFDAQWEVRHGAAMAIRDALKYHAASAGRCVPRLVPRLPPSHTCACGCVVSICTQLLARTHALMHAFMIVMSPMFFVIHRENILKEKHQAAPCMEVLVHRS
jgi:hypothetical protein